MALRKWMTYCFVALFTTSLLVPTSSWASETDQTNAFTMTVSSVIPAQGDRIEVVIDGHQLTDVYAFEINIAYDPTRLTFIDAKSDAAGFSVPPIVKGGQLQLAHTQVGKGKSFEGELNLFKLHFQAMKNGKSDLTLSNIKAVNTNLVSTTKQINASTSLFIHTSLAFDDLASFDWAIEAIEHLAANGIVNGTGERQFSPGSAVTRADYLVLLMRALGLKGTAGESFDDIETGVYYAEPVAMARSLGIVQGDEANQFHPQASITREDMMVLTDRALRVSKQLSVSGDKADLTAFNDLSSIADYALESVSTLVIIGLVHGYANGIHPKETTNRAQAAVLINNLLAYIK